MSSFSTGTGGNISVPASKTLVFIWLNSPLPVYYVLKNTTAAAITFYMESGYRYFIFNNVSGSAEFMNSNSVLLNIADDVSTDNKTVYV